MLSRGECEIVKFLFAKTPISIQFLLTRRKKKTTNSLSSLKDFTFTIQVNEKRSVTIGARHSRRKRSIDTRETAYDFANRKKLILEAERS